MQSLHTLQNRLLEKSNWNKEKHTKNYITFYNYNFIHYIFIVSVDAISTLKRCIKKMNLVLTWKQETIWNNYLVAHIKRKDLYASILDGQNGKLGSTSWINKLKKKKNWKGSNKRRKWFVHRSLYIKNKKRHIFH